MSNCPINLRMREAYEYRTRYYLPRRTYVILRLDQKSGSNYTSSLDKPFDQGYIEDYDAAVLAIIQEIQGAKFAYVQSDEVSILLTDFDDINTQAWFDSNLQKIVSISASLMTAEFNRSRLKRQINSDWQLESIYHNRNKEEALNCLEEFKLAHFDSRAFTIPDPVEVHNYMLGRQRDCTKNSVSMAAQSLFSHNELHGKNNSEMQEMMYAKGRNWAGYPAGIKNGRIIAKREGVWSIEPAEIFSKSNQIRQLIPPMPSLDHLVQENGISTI